METEWNEETEKEKLAPHGKESLTAGRRLVKRTDKRKCQIRNYQTV